MLVQLHMQSNNKTVTVFVPYTALSLIRRSCASNGFQNFLKNPKNKKRTTLPGEEWFFFTEYFFFPMLRFRR